MQEIKYINLVIHKVKRVTAGFLFDSSQQSTTLRIGGVSSPLAIINFFKTNIITVNL